MWNILEKAEVRRSAQQGLHSLWQELWAWQTLWVDVGLNLHWGRTLQEAELWGWARNQGLLPWKN